MSVGVCAATCNIDEPHLFRGAYFFHKHNLPDIINIDNR